MNLRGVLDQRRARILEMLLKQRGAIESATVNETTNGKLYIFMFLWFFAALVLCTLTIITPRPQAGTQHLQTPCLAGPPDLLSLPQLEGLQSLDGNLTFS